MKTLAEQMAEFAKNRKNTVIVTESKKPKKDRTLVAIPARPVTISEIGSRFD